MKVRRNINLQDDTYLRLTALMEPKESYNDVVERLLNLYLNVKVLSRGLEPVDAGQKFKNK